MCPEGIPISRQPWLLPTAPSHSTPRGGLEGGGGLPPTGEGTVPRVELVNPAQKSLNFGAIRVGEVVKRLVKVTCKSKVWQQGGELPWSIARTDEQSCCNLH